jgi:hypothetical protein
MRLMLAFLCIGVSLSSIARADFNGEWTGTGDLTGGFDLHCDNISVQLTQNATEFSLSNASVQCSFIDESFDDESYQIQGNQLWHDNEAVGQISATAATTQVSGSGYTGTVSMTLTSANDADFTADLDKDGSTYHLTGKLQKN